MKRIPTVIESMLTRDDTQQWTAPTSTAVAQGVWSWGGSPAHETSTGF